MVSELELGNLLNISDQVSVRINGKVSKLECIWSLGRGRMGRRRGEGGEENADQKAKNNKYRKTYFKVVSL